MTRPIKTYLGVTLLYIPMSWVGNGRWALLLAPLFAFIAMLCLLFAPHAHKWVFGDDFYKIKPANQHKEKETE